jgi:hypothetical protein
VTEYGSSGNPSYLVMKPSNAYYLYVMVEINKDDDDDEDEIND